MSKRLGAALAFLVLAVTCWAQKPTVGENGVVNGATFIPFGQPGHANAPGSIVSIFGTNFASSLSLASTIPLSTSLGGVSVTFNGVATPLYVVSPGQINAQLPFGLTGDTVSIVVTNGGGSSDPRQIQIAPTSPGIFTDPPGGAGQGIVVFALEPTVFAAVPSQRLPSSRRAKAGDFLTIYCNGLGAVQPPVASGDAAPGSPPLAETVAKPVVTIGGAQASLLFSGLVPGLVGLYQINIQVPNGVRTGDAVPLQIQMGNYTSSAAVTIAIQ
jgi:uncharacterized protein (TIGR03437 family)